MSINRGVAGARKTDDGELKGAGRAARYSTTDETATRVETRVPSEIVPLLMKTSSSTNRGTRGTLAEPSPGLLDVCELHGTHRHSIFDLNLFREASPISRDDDDEDE
jgi:hypothetical protein